VLAGLILADKSLLAALHFTRAAYNKLPPRATKALRRQQQQNH